MFLNKYEIWCLLLLIDAHIGTTSARTLGDTHTHVQVLANLNALNSDAFGKDQLGRPAKVGEVDHSKLNLWGGSLAIGHPFGATGSRLVSTAADRLIAEGGKYAILAACADSGLAHCALLERCEH